MVILNTICCVKLYFKYSTEVLHFFKVVDSPADQTVSI